MKKLIALILTAAVLFSGCTPIEDPITKKDADISTGSSTSNVAIVEGAPEETTTPAVYDGEPQLDIPDGFPTPTPVNAVDDPELLAQFTEIITQAIEVESVLYGNQSVIPLDKELSEGYMMVSLDYAGLKSEMQALVADPFASYYWRDTYDGMELDQLLFEDTSLGGVPRFEYVDHELAFYPAECEKQIPFDISTLALTWHEGDYATVVALGTLDGKDYWKTYSMIDGYRGWVIEAVDVSEVTGEIALFNTLLSDDIITLNKIFGGATPIYDEDYQQVREYVSIEDDIYGHGFYYGLEVEPFMTIEEMRAFVKNMFTPEIADSYISLYINRVYIEKDGRLFMKEGAVLPQMGTFSLVNYENFSLGTFDVVSYVDWYAEDSEEAIRLLVTVVYEDGVWKLDTRIPMKADAVTTRAAKYE